MTTPRLIRIGMLTPSSNTVLEPVTSAMIASAPDVSVHFSRFRVTEIALSDAANAQFAEDHIMRAAELLAHAKVDVIAWNGTSASWLGLDRDRALCERITAETGTKACTSVLAFREIFDAAKVGRLALVTPYTSDVQEKIMRNWSSEGIECVAERHMGLRDNFSFAEVTESTVADMVRQAVRQTPCDAAAVICTNMRGAGSAARLEQELGIPVYDSIATTLWKCLGMAGADPAMIGGWGSLFSDLRPSGADDA